jgi:hypothetical protein
MMEPMRTERLSDERSLDRYPDRELVRGFEGGVCTALREPASSY